MKQFSRIGKDKQNTMVANFLETIGNLEALDCGNLDETADAIEVIGLRIRAESPGKGLIMLAKAIIDRSASANF